jgi:hypothetical protein
MSAMAAITAIARMMTKSFARTLQMCRWETGVRGGWLPVARRDNSTLRDRWLLPHDQSHQQNAAAVKGHWDVRVAVLVCQSACHRLRRAPPLEILSAK